jgi:hypothetical protein
MQLFATIILSNTTGCNMDDEKDKKIAELEAQIAQLKKPQPAAIEVGNDVKGSTLVAGEGHLVNTEVHEGGQFIHIVGGQVTFGSPRADNLAVERTSGIGRYLEHIIAQNRFLELQGIRSSGLMVSVELEKIYITLHASWHRGPIELKDWLDYNAEMTQGEIRSDQTRVKNSTVEQGLDASQMKVEEALALQKHLVILGDPGSGKTTLLRFLAMLYARDLVEGGQLVKQQLQLEESGLLPIILPFRQVGVFMQAQPQDGTEGHNLLLQFLTKSLKNENINLSDDFWGPYLKQGKAIVLLDGLDEVSDPNLRERVALLARNFARAYPLCRFVVTSRIIGYIDTVRLGDDFHETTVRDFSLSDIRAFLTRWHQAVTINQRGLNQSALDVAAGLTRQLTDAILANERIMDLAINPLMLTVIALIHRDQVKMPDRRAELYSEAVDVLLGKRDRVRGIKDHLVLDGQPFDTGDRRLLLQHVAFWMHAQGRKEITLDEIKKLLTDYFYLRCAGEGERKLEAARHLTDQFLQSVAERSGLIHARGEGVFSFSHLTFQEFLAAVALADRKDYIKYSIKQVGKDWWREVLLLEAGHLSNHGSRRATDLIRSIASCKKEPEPYHNLVLAAECVRDVGDARLEGGFAAEIRARMQSALRQPRSSRLDHRFKRFFRRTDQVHELTRQRVVVATAFGRIGGMDYWRSPYGEPDWVHIPAGSFWMGSEKSRELDERPLHQVTLADYWIAPTPITCTQYSIFLRETDHRLPDDWKSGKAPRGRELHPVINVSWNDVHSYCLWLGGVTGKPIRLPSSLSGE